jgi:hypothetical protein
MRYRFFKVPLRWKIVLSFIVYSESISVDKQSYQISASNSISFCLFFQRKHANFSCKCVDFFAGELSFAEDVSCDSGGNVNMEKSVDLCDAYDT